MRSWITLGGFDMDGSNRIARGTSLLTLTSEFRIRIHYREPTYESHQGEGQRPYRWTYRIEAENVEQAKAIAIAEFHDLARLSSVGWTREITDVLALD